MNCIYNSVIMLTLTIVYFKDEFQVSVLSETANIKFEFFNPCQAASSACFPLRRISMVLGQERASSRHCCVVSTKNMWHSRAEIQAQ